MKKAVEQALLNSCTYFEFKELISDLLFEGLSTGNNQSEELLQYSTLNEIRLKRLDKTILITEDVSEKLKSIDKKYIWLVIAEGWCGDAAQVLPVLNKMAMETDAVDLRIVLRDKNDELMSHFLTNGARSIPKLIIIDKESGNICNHWGPRPQGALDLIQNYKKQYGVVTDEAKTQLQLWYLKDKGFSIQEEVVEMMYATVDECICV